MVTPNRRASLDVRLFFWWDALPPGTAVTMNEMLDAMHVNDAQTIRSSLTRLRKGGVRDPSGEGHLVPKPIRFDWASHRYYDLSKSTPDTVAAQVPGRILAERMAELLTRALTLESALGSDGLALSASQYLANDDIKELIRQLPTEAMWNVHGVIQELAKARQLLAIEEATRQQESLPPNLC